MGDSHSDPVYPGKHVQVNGGPVWNTGTQSQSIKYTVINMYENYDAGTKFSDH